MQCSPEQQAIITLNLVPEIGPRSFQALLRRFGSAAAVLAAGEEEIAAAEKSSAQLAAGIVRTRHAGAAERELEEARSAGVRIVTCIDDDYPGVLKVIGDYPPVIYVRGTLCDGDALAVALVGTRHPTVYGRGVAERFGRELAGHGVTVVSGLARGIDTWAHMGALDAGGRTLAVLGNGLLQHYPPENRQLEERIARQGALVSEFPLHTGPDRTHFPRRNRLIAALSLGTVVIEAAAKSGALITADFCAEQGKDVFAVPGPIFAAYSRGPNELLRAGAHPALSVQDIVEVLGPIAAWVRERPRPAAGTVPARELDRPQRRIVAVLEEEPDGVSIDALAGRCSMDVRELAAHLLDLELRGEIRSLPGKMYARRR